MENPIPEPCPCCGAEMETFRRRAATASRPEGWRVLRPKTNGCSICRYLAEGSFDVSVRLIEDWNRRAIALVEEKETKETLIFGKTQICSIHASMNNPHKVGTYVETIRRRGRMNPGKHYRVTDGKGDFWEVPKDNALIEPNE